MKRIVVVLSIILPMVAHGASMCVNSDAVMVVLDPQIAGTALSNNSADKTWSTQFSYGVVSGIAGCYSDVCNTIGCVATDQVNITQSSTAGNNCYCKMLKPVESLWVWGGTPDSYACQANCARKCSSSVATDVRARSGLFNNIVQ